MSETRDLGVPVLVLLAAIAVAAWCASAGQATFAVASGALGLVGAGLALKLTLRKAPLRATATAVGSLLLLAALSPAFETARLAWIPWSMLAFAASLARSTWSPRTRVALLAVAVLLVVAALVVILLRLPNAGLWAAFAVAGAFACALNVVVSRPRPVAATAVGPVVGVFGGSFDPFHLGHRAICEAALAVVQRLLVVVSARPPHKQGARELSAFHHRVAMTRIGIEGLPRTEVLELENRREGPSYTIDTLEALGRLFPPGSRFRLVLGADSFQDFPTWKDWEGILEKADLLVVGRPGHDLEPPPEFEGRNAPVERLDVPPNEASSTAVRARVIAGEPPGPMVSAAVAAYIGDHGLYKDGTGGGEVELAAPRTPPA